MNIDYIHFIPGGGTFTLEHSGYAACGIPVLDSIVMTGGTNPYHNYVTRWVGAKSLGPPLSSLTSEYMVIVIFG